MKKLLLLLFVALSFQAFSQKNYYWVKFKDKENNSFSLSDPLQFLTQQSLDRRTKQGIELDSTDLPITQSYIDAVTPFVGHLKHRLKWFNMLVVRIDSSVYVDSIRQLPFVEGINRIYYNPLAAKKDKFEYVTANPNQNYVYPNLYGQAYRQINMLNADLLHQLGHKGQGILMTVLDNGFVNCPQITAFDSVRPRILKTWDFVNDEENVYNDGGHGLSCFSTIAANIPNHHVGTAPDASFVLCVTEDDNDEWVMEEYNWEAGAELADSLGAQLFSTSLGYTDFSTDSGNHTYADMNGNTTVITRAANRAASKGILVINSAGNEGANSWHYIAAPADGDSVIAVGAVDSAEVIASFSSRGPSYAGRVKPDLCAQGVKSAVIATDGSLGYSGGTSFSCPTLAGCFASLWSAFPDKSAKDIYTAVVVSADRFWTPDSTYGYGIPNFYNAYLLLNTGYNANVLKTTGEVTAYPNPFADNLQLGIYNDEAGQHTIELFDVSGRKVLSKQVFLRKKTFEIISLNEVNNLLPGEYLLKVDGKLKDTRQLIKVK
ncbi:MAG: S8 family serine peptidase [Chitinophagales bacterium]